MGRSVSTSDTSLGHWREKLHDLPSSRTPRMTTDTSRQAPRLLALLTHGDRRWWVLAVATTLLVAWGISWSTGEEIAVSRHLFYVPVVIAAVRFTPPAAIGVAGLAGLLAGPLVPLPEVGIGFAEHGPWVIRTLFLVAIGGLVAALSQSNRRYQHQQLELAAQEQAVTARERDLAIQRAAMVQTVSHELRTPLTILKGTVETWAKLQAHITPEPAARLIPPMKRATQRLESLVSTVLAAADAQQADDLVAVPTEVAELLYEAVARAGDPESRARVERSVDGAPESVTTVPDYVTTALSLLVNNALKFSPSDCPVTVTAGAAGGDHFEIAVRDLGDGIDTANIEQLFEPFTQADQGNTRVHAGLGVGLYTSRKLIRSVGGEVTIANHADRGTVSRIILPLEYPTGRS